RGAPRARRPHDAALGRDRQRTRRTADGALSLYPARASRLAGAIATRHEAPVAERRPRSRARTARAAAADRRVLDLGAQLLHDAGGGRFLERGGLLDRHASGAGVLQREPAQDRRLARRLLGLGEARAGETLWIEEPAEHRLLRRVARDGAGERAEQRE